MGNEGESVGRFFSFFTDIAVYGQGQWTGHDDNIILIIDDSIILHKWGIDCKCIRYMDVRRGLATDGLKYIESDAINEQVLLFRELASLTKG